VTADELRRLAERKRRMAVSRDRAVGALVGVVRSIDGCTDALITGSQAAWVCNAARGFESHLRGQRRRIDEVVGDLRAAVNRLLEDVDRLRAEARSLEAQADVLDATGIPVGPV
jgi:hypothetical protein